MSLTEEQIKQVKEQLLQQIENFPEDKKANAKQQIEAMNAEELEQFLAQNNLVKQEGGQQKCVFCSLVFEEMPSTKVGENDKAIAILELNPVSKGHVLIIPKEHAETKEAIPKEADALADEIAPSIQKAFSPKNFLKTPSEVMGHWALNLIPVYDNETIESPRTQKTPEDLLKLQKEISEIEGSEEIPAEAEPQKEINEKNTWLPIRIP